MNTVFQITLLLLALNGFFYACEVRTLRRINLRGFTAACHVNYFLLGKKSDLYKGCFMFQVF